MNLQEFLDSSEEARHFADKYGKGAVQAKICLKQHYGDVDVYQLEGNSPEYFCHVDQLHIYVSDGMWVISENKEEQE